MSRKYAILREYRKSLQVSNFNSYRRIYDATSALTGIASYQCNLNFNSFHNSRGTVQLPATQIRQFDGILCHTHRSENYLLY